MRHRAVAVPVIVAATLSGLALSGCSDQGVSLARQACSHVKQSLTDFRESQDNPDAGTAEHLSREARLQLLYALPIAAQANSENGQWNALMTTISEVARVDESHLVDALHAQCKLADSNQPDQGPAGGGTTPGNGTLPPTSSPASTSSTSPTTTSSGVTSSSSTTSSSTTSSSTSSSTTTTSRRSTTAGKASTHRKVDGETPVNGTLPGTPKPPK